MNAIFVVILISGTIILGITAPQDFLPTLMDGAKSACDTALSLFFIYAVWMGISKVAEESRLNEKFAYLLQPVCRKLFKTQNKDACKDIAMNLSCNLLGLGGAATPFAVSAIDKLESDKNEFAQKMLFIINATSVQIIPTTVIALRAESGSESASDIILPSLICTTICTVLACVIFILCQKLARKAKEKCS